MDDNFGQWYGVHVYQRRVVKLILRGNLLRGTIPDALGSLSGLKVLDLSNNQLKGHIPKKLGDLGNLELLRLQENQLSGCIPLEIGNLGALQELNLYSNRLSGSIPTELGNLSALRTLNVSGNELKGQIPASLGHLGNLQQLSCFWNKLNGPIPKQLGAPTKMKQLSLTRNCLTGTVPKELGALSELVELWLSSNQLEGHIPKELGGLGNLERLGLQGNKLSGRIPKELGFLWKLKGLWLNSNQLAGPIPKELGALTELKEFSLSNNRVTGCAPVQLIKCTNLQQLNLGNNQLSDAVPSIEQLRNLHRALLDPSSGVEDEKSVKGQATTATSMMSKAQQVRLGVIKQRKGLGEAEIAAGNDPGTGIGDTLATIIDFEGDVVAWSFGERPEVLCGDGAEFELDVPDLGRNIPALIGLSSGSAEVVDGKHCLLHPIVTCLAQEGEGFDPPLCLRFPVGDVHAMESGSDCGTSDDAEIAYQAYLESTFSAWTREDAHSAWVPTDGAIRQREGGDFVLEVTVSHFCDFALKQDIEVSAGGVEQVELTRLKRKSRRGRYHFVNLGTDTLLIHCWGAARRRSFLESFKLKLGVGSTGGGVEAGGTRKLVDMADTLLETVQVPGKPDEEPRRVACLMVDGEESLTLAHTTQETVRSLMGSSHTLVQVWGRRSMNHKHAMLFGPLKGAERLVSNLRVEDGVDVGKVVKSVVG